MPKFSDHVDCSEGTTTRSTLSVRCDLTGGSGATMTLDLDALGLAQGQRPIPADSKIVGAHVECETAVTFSGTTTGLALVVGITGTTNGFLTTASIASLTAGQTSDLGGLGTLINRLRANSAPALEAVATASGGAAVMSEVATGVIWIHLEWVNAKQCV